MDQTGRTMDKQEELQLLLDLTTDAINEIALSIDLEQITSVELFQEAVSQAVIQFQFNTRKPSKHSPIGKVDTKNVAFQLQDEEATAAILQGPADWLDDTEFDTLGGDEPNDD
jgi:hypothetical protein